MAPKRGISKRGGRDIKRGARSNSMALRSGSFKRKVIDQEASSRVMPRSTPQKKKTKCSKRSIFVDDEAQVEEDSNVIEDEGNESKSDDGKDKNEVDEHSTESDIQVKTKHARQMGKQVPIGIMNDVLSQFYIKRRSPPPLVPLCRLVPHEAIRFASDEASWLIPSFDTAAYLETMGSFLVSIEGTSGEFMSISAQNLEEWDPIWTQKSAEFDKSLRREWQDLKGRKFLVWDGNHRVKTWLKRVKDVYYDRPEFHVSVRCQFISVEKRKEAELLLALDTTNAITRAHVRPNLAHEIYMFQKFGIANKESILDRLSHEQRKWAEMEMTVETRLYHGVAPWYNSPCALIAQLVWKDDFNAYITKETTKIKGLGLSEQEEAKRLDKAIRDEEQRLKDKGYKYLAIANPSNGEEFFALLFGLKWDDVSMTRITKDKLYTLCSAKIPPERKKVILHLMSLTKAKDPQSSHFGDAKSFRAYMRKESHWAQMYVEAALIIQKLEVEGPRLPEGFDEFYKLSLKTHVAHAYANLLDKMKNLNDRDKVVELECSTRRIIYRWFLECKSEGRLHQLPDATMEWISMAEDTTMYSQSIRDHGITQWEAEKCPWWVEYPIGVIPKQEKEIYEKFFEERKNATTEQTPIEEGNATTEQTPIEEGNATPIGDLGDTLPSKGDCQEPSKESKRSRKKKKKSEARDSVLQGALSYVSKSSMVRVGLSATQTNDSTLGSIERRPLCRQKGFQYQTRVDALLMDLENVDDFGIESIKEFLRSTNENPYAYNGESSKEVARLIFVDFPTSLLVDGLPIPKEAPTSIVPEWNVFTSALVKGSIEVASLFLADEGFLVTLSLAEHFGKVKKYAARASLHVHRTWTVVCDVGYRHPITREEVCDLTLGLFYRGNKVPYYDRDGGEEICPRLFPATRSFVVEDPTLRTLIDGVPVRGGAERTSLFLRWLLATFSKEKDCVLDLLSGCGGLGIASTELRRHCLCVEADSFAYAECLTKIACEPFQFEEE